MIRTYHSNPGEFYLGEILIHQMGFVQVFGRERDKNGVVVYYWVVCDKQRFKAWPEDLQKL